MLERLNVSVMASMIHEVLNANFSKMARAANKYLHLETSRFITLGDFVFGES
jgi:hypothetical protein